MVWDYTLHHRFAFAVPDCLRPSFQRWGDSVAEGRQAFSPVYEDVPKTLILLLYDPLKVLKFSKQFSSEGGHGSFGNPSLHSSVHQCQSQASKQLRWNFQLPNSSEALNTSAPPSLQSPHPQRTGNEALLAGPMPQTARLELLLPGDFAAHRTGVRAGRAAAREELLHECSPKKELKRWKIGN